MLHFKAVIRQKMEVDFTGKTFQMVDHLTGELMGIVVFVAVLPYSQLIYMEGMVSTKEPQWIAVNNNALLYFDGVPALVVCDNCKQAVIANRDWISPELSKDYSEWAEHDHTVMLPAKVKNPSTRVPLRTPSGFWKRVSSMKWRRWTISVWSSLAVTYGCTWKHSTTLRSRRSRITGTAIGKRSARNSCAAVCAV